MEIVTYAKSLLAILGLFRNLSAACTKFRLDRIQPGYDGSRSIETPFQAPRSVHKSGSSYAKRLPLTHFSHPRSLRVCQ